MNNYSRRYRMPCTTTTITSSGPATILSRPRLPGRSFMKPKSSFNLCNLDATPFCRSKRFKSSRKIGGCQKIDGLKKKIPDYTETVYREAVSKLKYLLAESYAPRLLTGKSSREKLVYRRSNLRISENFEDSDDRSVSECSRTKGFTANQFDDGNVVGDNVGKSRRMLGMSQNSVVPVGDAQSSHSELTSFIARQEEYIEQLEQESRFCKDELKNLLEKIREVVAENEVLHDKNNKAGLLKCFLKEYESCEENGKSEKQNTLSTEASMCSGKKVKLQKIMEGPNIVFESRISELEAQLTQARIELRKAREENETNAKRLTENCGAQASPEFAAQLDQALRDKRELSGKLDEALRSLQAARDRENEVTQKAKRATELAQQADFDKYQADSEIRRLNDELDRQREKLREISQETSRRVAEERHQVERRYSQQVEQLSADVASHWDAASKSQMETEKQRRELGDLKRDLIQKQSMIDELKKELQNKISNLQSDLNRAVAEKDAAEQEVAAAKLAVERCERNSRQEQSRWQAEVNSYKQRLERADADIVHCRRENLRLSEQISSLEKELNMTKLVKLPETQTPAITPRAEPEKDMTSMIMDLETKHAATVGGLEDALNNQAKLVSRLTAECQSLTQRLEANDRTHKETMASLQSNLEYLSSKINDTLDIKKAGQAINSDRNNTAQQHKDEIAQSNIENSVGNNYNQISTGIIDGNQSYTGDYNVNSNAGFDDPNVVYPRHEENIENTNSQDELIDNQQNYGIPEDRIYNEDNYRMDNDNYPADYMQNQNYAQYEQYDPSIYQQDPNADDQRQQQLTDVSNADYQQDQQHYDNYNNDNYSENQQQSIKPEEQQQYDNSAPLENNITEA